MNTLIRFLILALAACTVGAETRPGSSIYHLDVTLQDQSGVKHGLSLYEGQPVLVTMFYGSCPMACPLLIDTLRATERAAMAQQRAELRVLLISVDPDRDTTEALAKLAAERRIELSRWTLARTDAASVRKIAALLNIQYRKLPNGAFNHTSVITLLDRAGSIRAHTTTISKADPSLMAALASIGPPVAVAKR